jgi:hypothetical protein
MTAHAEPIPVDIDTMPDLVRLADEVRATDTPRLLRREGKGVALLVPAPKRRRPRKRVDRKRTKRKRSEWKPTKEDMEAFYRSAGGWADMDTDKLVENIYADRRISDRPRVDL